MNTLLRIEAETLPRLLVLNPPVSDAEFEAFCRDEDGNKEFGRSQWYASDRYPCCTASI